MKIMNFLGIKSSDYYKEVYHVSQELNFHGLK